MKVSDAQKIAKAKHWIKTYEKRIAEGDAIVNRIDTKRWAFRKELMRDKIQRWERLIRELSRKRETVITFDILYRWAQGYFGKPNIDFSNRSWKYSTNKTLLCKYLIDHGFSSLEASKRFGIHINQISRRRNKYNPKTMGSDYRQLKEYLDARISKELEIRSSRKSQIEQGSKEHGNPNPQYLQGLRSEILQHRTSILC